jgi:HSP20 family protein
MKRSQGRGANAFGTFQRMFDDMDRMFDELGLGRRRRSRFSSQGGIEGWMPDVDVSQRNSELCITIDLPGMKPDEISVEVTDEAIRIEGERRREHEEESGGVYRTERSYGTFHRVIPLPDGAITDEAKASFRDGVLEITVPCPPASTKGRRLEIRQEENRQ